MHILLYYREKSGIEFRVRRRTCYRNNGFIPCDGGTFARNSQKHSELITELNDEYVERMFRVGKFISRGMRKTSLKLEAISFVLSDGKSAGQKSPCTFAFDSEVFRRRYRFSFRKQNEIFEDATGRGCG